MSGKQTIAHAQRQAANSGCLRRLVGRFGVKACYKSLTQVHGFDPEIAWLAIWYSRHHALPRRMGWAMDTRGVTAAPMTHAEATGFLDEYTNNRGRWSAPNTGIEALYPVASNDWFDEIGE